MKVPAGDLYAQYLSLKTEIDAAIASVIAESAFVRGRFVDAFEQAFAAAAGANHCVSCANGTDALYVAMHALGVKPGDEVITTAHSWIATSETITQGGARVVFCDTERDSFNIDPAAVTAKITDRTVGIIPVHLAGQPADMDPILALAARHKLWVIEDCAQAHLATYKGRPVGTMGVCGTFSFYPGKNLGAMGDAGAIVTGDAALAQQMAMFARHGGLTKGEHLIEGVNSRLDGLQAAILSAKLPHLAGWTQTRRRLAARYAERLAGAPGLSLPTVRDDVEHVFHLFMVRHEARDALAAHLTAAGVQTVVNYPTALPFLKAYERFAHGPGQFPNAFHNQSRILSLPLFAEMSLEQQDHVIAEVRRFCDTQARTQETPEGAALN